MKKRSVRVSALQGKNWGITDGEWWFAYAYGTQEEAERICKILNDDPDRIHVNVHYPAPLKYI